MEYRVIDDFRDGMPQTPTGTVGPFLMIALHDTEGGVGDVGSLGTIYFLINTGPTRNASYHELWGWDEDIKRFTVRRIVPPSSAAHSVNPVPPPGGSYEPDAKVREALGARWQDPNRVIYAVSISGKKADVDRWSKDPDFVACVKRRLNDIQRYLVPSGRKGEHFRINPSTRTDWGSLLTPAIEEEMPVLTNFAIERITLDGNSRVRSAPTTNSEKSFLTAPDLHPVVTRIGTQVNAEGEWSVYWVNAWNNFGYTLKQNVLKVEQVDTQGSIEDLSDELNVAMGRIGKKDSALAAIATSAEAARKL